MLAKDGGTPIRKTPFPARHLFGEEEKQRALALFEEAVQSGGAIGYGGVEEQSYEAEFAQFLGGGYADLVNSGTAALYVALGALELEPAGEVIVPPITDPGGVMPVALLNLIPVVADAWPGSFNAGPDEIEALLTPWTRAIVVAHIAGEAADMDPIMELAQARNLPVIEDCAQAHGTLYKGRPAGSIGTIAAFSTMSGKHHATGPQGGVVFTRHEDLYWRTKRFADRGKPFNLDNPSNGRAGLNLNGNDLAAAIGRVQLAKLPDIIARRRHLAGQINQGLQGLQTLAPGRELEDSQGVYWFMRIQLDTARLTCDKETFTRALAAEGIPVNPTYRHIPSEADWFRQRKVFGQSDYPWGLPAYQGDTQATFPCPQAVAAVESHFILPLHEKYSDREVEDILGALRKVEEAYLG
ncbi:MAG: hypothetical protein GKR89_08170 [Candidatus Latescibacteria bacterium]|nr:hypothetical protein [Candidatus Latescibacterota bacterium]